jgi:hypothetical protein
VTIFLSEDYMPTVNLNRPAIEPGQITEADLAAARQHSAGNLWLLPRRASACTGNCRQGRDCTCTPDTGPTDYSVPGWLDSCAPEGGKAREPVAAESMLRHRRHAATIKAAAALAVVVVVVGYVFQVI